MRKFQSCVSQICKIFSSFYGITRVTVLAEALCCYKGTLSTFWILHFLETKYPGSIRFTVNSCGLIWSFEFWKVTCKLSDRPTITVRWVSFRFAQLSFKQNIFLNKKVETEMHWVVYCHYSISTKLCENVDFFWPSPKTSIIV